MKRLITSKKKEIWFAFIEVKVMSVLHDDGYCWTAEDHVEANSYSELQIEIGNKGWIDMINKND